ncbi:EamA family transporter [Vibrio sp.]|jgi:phosphonate utilization associated putative membrane protein|uniref:EamA family transporter n=1 Tax=Vibrio sp. TaxID=678 RepID=UPI00311D9A78
MVNNALVLLALSVFMHVAWNVMTRFTDKRANFLWWGLLAHTLIFAPWSISQLVIEARWNDELILALLFSVITNVFYFFALRRAYHFASVSFVYPIARSSPILIAFWAWALFDDRLSLMGFSGIFISIFGLWLLAKFDSGLHTASALKWALLAALGTSIYSVSDKVAVNYLPTFGAQLGYISVGYFASFVFLSLEQYKKTDSFVPEQKPKWFLIFTGGLFIGVAYALVVRAMVQLPASAAVAISNSGIVLATLVSVLIFKEKESAFQRLFCSIVISLGIALVVIDL